MSVVRLGRLLLAGLIVGLMGIVFAISFAAIIYSGGMAAYLSHGIGLTLLGAAVMALVGSLLRPAQGIIVQPQDVTALILSLGVASVAHGWGAGAHSSLFATVAALVAVTTAVTGLVMYLFGRFSLGFVIRFIPYPVLGGFLAATGYLLVTGALGMMLKENARIWSFASLLQISNSEKWMPWMLAGIGFCLASRYIRHAMVLPACILISIAGFYGVLWVSGTGVAAAQAQGLLLGPFNQTGFLDGLSPAMAGEANWFVVFAQLPTMLAVAGMAIIGSLLNVSALELTTGEDVNPNEDLRGVGAANLVSALFGGLVGFQLLTETLFARSMGITGRLAGVSVAVVMAAAALFGAKYLSVLPIGVFAAIVAYLGIDLLFTWLWTERQKLPSGDFAIVLLILAVSATVGLLQAIAVGLLAASIRFVTAYARIDVVRVRTSVASMRSSVERALPQMQYLSQYGGKAVVYELYGYLFFGTAYRLLTELSAVATTGETRPEFILVDFKRVTGIDASAAYALGKLHGTCEDNGLELYVSGLAPKVEAQFRKVHAPEGLRVFGHLDEALRNVEERLLAKASAREIDASTPGFLEELKRLHPGFEPESTFEDFSAEAGQRIIEQGMPTDSILVLREGRLRVEYVHPDGTVSPVAEILPGALVGEIGLYAQVPRTAHVVAAQACRLARISLQTLERLAEDNPRLAADIHRLSAAYLARRLMRATSLLRDAGV